MNVSSRIDVLLLGRRSDTCFAEDLLKMMVIKSLDKVTDFASVPGETVLILRVVSGVDGMLVGGTTQELESTLVLFRFS